jgi:hypothetical protein
MNRFGVMVFDLNEILQNFIEGEGGIIDMHCNAFGE